MGHFLQITIARKIRLFLKKHHTISSNRKLQNRASFCKLRSQEKLDHFSRKTIQFLLITNSRNGPLSVNSDRKKNYKISQENYTNSRDRKLQKRATFCKLRSPEKLDHFSRKTIQFLVVAKCNNKPLSANYDRKKN